MTNSPINLSDLIGRVNDSLCRSIASLSDLITRDAEARAYINWKLELLWELRDFQTLLLKHFDLEEEGPYNAALIREAPHCAPRLDELEDQHHNLLTALSRIIADLKQADTIRKAGEAQVCSHIKELLGRVQRHEAAERDLLQDVYFQDYGTGD